MGSTAKLLDKLRRQPHNTRFGDLVRAVEAVGFVLHRHHGTSHMLFRHRDEPGLRLNLQPRGGRAKSYQVQDFLEKVKRYNLADD